MPIPRAPVLTADPRDFSISWLASSFSQAVAVCRPDSSDARSRQSSECYVFTRTDRVSLNSGSTEAILRCAQSRPVGSMPLISFFQNLTHRRLALFLALVLAGRSGRGIPGWSVHILRQILAMRVPDGGKDFWKCRRSRFAKPTRARPGFRPSRRPRAVMSAPKASPHSDRSPRRNRLPANRTRRA